MDRGKDVLTILAAVMFVLAGLASFGVIGGAPTGYAFFGIAAWLLST